MRQGKLGFCYPGYRYCGPGCTGPGSPTNPVDNCCKYHDECYMYYRHPRDRRYCDDLFQQCLNQYKYQNNKLGKDARLFSNVIGMKNFFF
ncbi:MAG TPA: Parvovirus coat protein VP1-like protein [Ureibacillus sp.]|nr:Parvovirus coat protein VP1-like protein [Ureibacillus sp.]